MNAMNSAVEQPQTLRSMREAAQLSTRQAARLLAAFLQEEKRSHVSIQKIERNGTTKEEVIDGLASVYGQDRHVVSAAAKNLRHAGIKKLPDA